MDLQCREAAMERVSGDVDRTRIANGGTLGLQMEANNLRPIFGFKLPMVPTGIWRVLQHRYGNLTGKQQE